MTPLHKIGEFLRQLLLSVPLSGARILFLATLVAVLIWVLRLPPSATAPPGGARRWDENLKTTAVIALLIQIFVYALL